MLWPMNCIPRLCMGCLSPPSQNKTMDAKPGLGGCCVGASNLYTNLDSCTCADTKPGYKTWFYLAWIRHLSDRLWFNNSTLMYCLLALAFLFVSARTYACLYIWIRESSDLRLRPLLIQASLQMQGPTCPSHTKLAREAGGQLAASLLGLRASDSLPSPASP